MILKRMRKFGTFCRFSKFRGFAFSVDAVLAFMILAAVIASAFFYFNQSTSFLSSSRPVVQVVSQEGVNALSRVLIADIRREPVVVDFFSNGYLSDRHLNLSVLEVIGEFWASGNYSLASNLSSVVIPKVVPSTLNWALEFDGAIVAYSSAVPSSASLSSSKRFVSGLNNSAPLTGCIARSFVERIRGKQEVSTVYFGGFLGQGNFSVSNADVPSGVNVTSILIQANTIENFSFSVNGVHCANLTVQGSGVLNVSTWNVSNAQCILQVAPGEINVFSFNFDRANLTSSYFDGGFLQVVYETNVLFYEPNGRLKLYLPRVEGLVNLFSSFYIPGNLTNASAYLKFFNNYTTYMVVGNKTVFSTNGSESVQEVNVSNASFASLFEDYSLLSSQTVPFKLTAVANATGQTGNADIVLITDVSGSMAWRMDYDTGGVSVSNCSSPAINYVNTSRISVAKCIDKNFVEAIFEGPGNRIALVSFSSRVLSVTNLTNNSAYLNGVIDSYNPSGGTCVSCAINQAFDTLKSESPSGRKRYVIVMSDGVANYRSTSSCGNAPPFNEVDNLNSSYFLISGAGDGTFYDLSKLTAFDAGINQQSSFRFYGVDFENSSKAFMSAASGQVWEWNGASWSRVLNAGSNSLYGISVGSSFSKGFSVGSSGKIYKWNGISWSVDIDSGSNVFYDVDVFNSSFAFAAGNSGKIYKWNGASWAQDVDLGSQTFYDVKIFSSNSAIVSGYNPGGTPKGVIYKWNGATWSLVASADWLYFYAMDAVNDSYVLVGGYNGVTRLFNGSSLTVISTPNPAQVNGISFLNSSAAVAVTDSGQIWYWQSEDGNNNWNVLPPGFNQFEGNSTIGISCGDSSSCGSVSTPSTLNANYSSCRLFSEISNSTVNSVGFGPVATCTLGANTLQNVATCGNGSYFASSNASQLQDFYRSIALSIVQQQNASQVKNVTGSINTTLFSESYLEFVFEPEVVTSKYQQISLPFETEMFSNCTGSVFIPSEMQLDEFTVTSYTSDKWTSNVSVKNSEYNWKTVYNLSVYNSSFVDLGDAFMVRFNPLFLKKGEWNLISIHSGHGALNQSEFCSSFNKAFYRGRIPASVNYSSIFLKCTSKTVRVYYDLNHDGTSDGFVDVEIGSGLPLGANYTLTPNQLNVSTDAVDDSFMRLLNSLNLVQVNSSGVSGVITNPIDVKLDSSIGTQAVTNKGIPFLWGPAEATLLTWPKGATG